MPSVVEERDCLGPRKRRRDADPADLRFATNAANALAFQQQYLSSASASTMPTPPPTAAPFSERKVMPCPIVKRARVQYDEVEQRQQQQLLQLQLQKQAQPQPQSSLADGSRPTTRRIQTAPERYSSAQQPQSSPSKYQAMAIILAPCHICHRRPVRRSDLDSFAACERCSQRTCYVCIRGCPGWAPGTQSTTTTNLATAAAQDDDGSYTMRDIDSDRIRPDDYPDYTRGEGEEHHGMVCSRCCVERGSDGDVVCIGCLSR